MIQYVTIDEKEYPLLFSMRAVFGFMNNNNVDSLQGVEQKVTLEYDALLELFEQASKKGAKKEGSDLVLTAEELEDRIDEDPELFMDLQKKFNESKVMEAMNKEASEEFADKKK